VEICQTALLQTLCLLHTEAKSRSSEVYAVFMSACSRLIFVVRGGKTLQESQENMEKPKIQMKVCQWVERCQSGSTAIVEDCSCPLTTLQMADSVEVVNVVVQQDNKLFISCASAYTVIHDDPDYYRICARWLPKQLTDECEQAYMKMSIQVSQWHCEEGEVLLQWIVICNETRGNLFEPASKYHSMEWKHVSSSWTKNLEVFSFCWQSVIDTVLGL